MSHFGSGSVEEVEARRAGLRTMLNDLGAELLKLAPDLTQERSGAQLLLRAKDDADVFIRVVVSVNYRGEPDAVKVQTSYGLRVRAVNLKYKDAVSTAQKITESFAPRVYDAVAAHNQKRAAHNQHIAATAATLDAIKASTPGVVYERVGYADTIKAGVGEYEVRVEPTGFGSGLTGKVAVTFKYLTPDAAGALITEFRRQHEMVE